MLELPQQASDALGDGKSIPKIMLYKNRAISNLETLMDAKYLKDINVSEAIEFKKVHDGILDACEKNKVDLVVMGSHGTSGFDELLVGSQRRKSSSIVKNPRFSRKKRSQGFQGQEFCFRFRFFKRNTKTIPKNDGICQNFRLKPFFGNDLHPQQLQDYPSGRENNARLHSQLRH